MPKNESYQCFGTNDVAYGVNRNTAYSTMIVATFPLLLVCR